VKKAIFIFKLLAVFAILISIPLIYSGIKETLELKELTENYLITEGNFISYELYSEGNPRRHKSPTYSLTYIYQVDGIDYLITTDYGTSAIPQFGSPREILYDPVDPSDAVLSGANGNSTMIVVGILFLLIPAIMLFGWLIVTDRLPMGAINIFDVSIGLVMAVIGAAMIYGMTGTLSLTVAVKEYGFITLIPILMIAAGAYQAIKSMFGKQNH
jgi:hypothetical protein